MSTETARRPLLVRGLALASAIGLGAGGLAVGVVLVYLAVMIGFLLGFEPNAATLIVVSLVFVQGVGCAGVALAYVNLRPGIAATVREKLDVAGPTSRFRIGAAMPSLRDLVVVVGGYVLAFGGVFAAAVGITVYQQWAGTEIDTGTNQAVDVGMQHPEVLLLLVPASFLIIGPGEELLFRGVVQGRLREVFSPVPAILIASVVFAGLHWFAITGGSSEGRLVALAILVIPSLVFGATYEYTGNVVVPSLIHGAYNATLFTLIYVSIAFGGDLVEGGEMAVFALLGAF